MTRATNARIAGITFLAYIAAGLTHMALSRQAMGGVGIAAKFARMAQHTTEVRVVVLLGLISMLRPRAHSGADCAWSTAWDFLGGMWLVLIGVAMAKRSGLGKGWAIPSIVFGIALIILNAATFPWPPGDHGLIDIGPFCGVFILILSARLAFLGKRELPAMAAAPVPA